MSVRLTKQQIIEQIRSSAKAHGGIPLGRNRFSGETGIKKHDWYGRYWVSWSEAIREAGFTPNQMNKAYSEEWLIEKLIGLIRRLQRFPVEGHIRMESRENMDFPSHGAFSRVGRLSQWQAKVVAYCRERTEFEDVVPLCGLPSGPDESLFNNELTTAKVGYVYLFKHGSRREYKIGKTFNSLRREGEIALELPEKVEPIFYIRPDDPSGVESYWHKRFAQKRKEGEWFALTAQDIWAFKRWKRIY
jgi:hypothetical protein